MTGIPRSGSSLCCRLASELPDTVALSEPFRETQFEAGGGVADACDRVARLAASARRAALAGRTVASVQVAGRLDDDMVGAAASGGLRRRRATLGRIAAPKPLTARCRLVVKHNALFAALLPELGGRLPCIALVRNPVAVLASWATVDLPVQRGRVPAGERYDRGLAARLDAEPDVLKRRLAVLDWFFGRYDRHLPRDRVLRYEEVVRTGGAALFRLLGHPDAAARGLASRNASMAYDPAAVGKWLAALAGADGGWTRFYSRAECERAADAIAARAADHG